MKVFLLSPQRSGTRSFIELARQAGMEARHWPGNEFDTQVADLLPTLDTNALWDITAPLTKEADAFADFPYASVWREAALHYPWARFVIIRRPARAWAAAVKRFSGTRELSCLERFYYWTAIGRREERITGYSDEELIMGRDLFEVEAAYTLGNRLATFNLDDPHLTERLSVFLNIPLRAPFPHVTDA